MLRWRDHEREISGAEPATTNNRMEMTAAIRALEALKRPCRVNLHTDSTYLKRGITEWLPAWKRRGWKTAGGQSVKNADLWRRLEDACGRHHDVRWKWVRGHSGHEGNERADRLARDAAAGVPR